MSMLPRAPKCEGPGATSKEEAGARDPGFAGFAALARLIGFTAGSVSSPPGNCSSSLPAMAVRMKFIQMGSAAMAPVSLLPSDSRLS